VLHDRLVIWRGPLPADLGKKPEILLELCEQLGCAEVYIDSLKDAAVKISDDEFGGNLNRAIQMCIAEGVDVAGLHHQRKRTSGGEKPKSLDDIYGSTWIPAGAGSVILLWGAAGDAIVELVHLKQPINEIGPLHLEHDHRKGRTTVFRGFDALVFLRNRGAQGSTSTEAARAMFEKTDVTDNQRKKAQRQMEALVHRGYATRTEPVLGGTGGSEGARYHYVEGVLGAPDMSTGQGFSEASTAGAPDTPDIRDESPAQSTGHVTGQHRTALAPDTAPPFNRGAGVGEPSSEPEDEAFEVPF
jgi:replicative DNA helicase